MKKKIVILCSRLDLPGGIERAVVNCANLFNDHGHPVTVLILDETAGLFYPLAPSMAVEQLHLHFGITEKGNLISRKIALVQHIRQLKKALQRISPDVVIGTEYPLSIAGYFAARQPGVKVFAWEHHHFHWLPKNRFWHTLFRHVYPKLNVVVCNNKKEQALYQQIGCRAAVVPYVVPDQHLPPAPLDENTILSIGWLIHRKGVDLIPEIAKKVYEKHPDWKWRVIGKGPELSNLQRQIRELGLESFLEIVLPETHELTANYQHASVFVMTSRFECLPMVLLEANRNGLPCVAFDCPTGPADIIEDGVNGYLAPLEDITTMATKIELLIRDKQTRKRMGQAAYDCSRRYLPETIYRQWQALF